MKKSIQDNVNGSNNEDVEGDRLVDRAEADDGTIVVPPVTEDGKVMDMRVTI